ncbi:MAG: trans-2-enoyl-CoA reductase family protein [Candidatus Obscuribacter phosphatis]|uniref:Enoyl-[acyl-carrier-protein] reductase [NADH] n=1 Tax=Candidatus Obscuribacter phosphatis TaxID=1906157 RepID=A0A8J7PM84_9BACT|nr:trans-2-enoyl-CoA reductase family protein [Candidatus Obscuribacter phosphatis]
MVIKPRIRGFICVTAHPLGCEAHVKEQIAYVKKNGSIANAPKKVLVIGASTGYGLASRISAAFGGGAATVGVFFEKTSEGGKPATAGWYNTLAFDREARAAGLYTHSINGDAFSDEIKAKTVEVIKKDLGQVDLVVYSLASPRRIHPRTGVVYNSVLKPINQSFTAKTLDTDKEVVKDISIEPANEQEIADTVQVMGGEDWLMWMDALKSGGVLAEGVKTVAYSYIGPEVTWPIYRDGSIGKAKADVEVAAKKIEADLAALGCKAYVSINKALVTQASSAIPVVPLYISLLYKIMKEKGLHEGCIEQMYRLFAENLYGKGKLNLDSEGRIRIDDKEMQDDVQNAVKVLWEKVSTENLKEISDFATYRSDFLKLFGFGFAEVNYDEPIDPAYGQ